VTYSVLMGMLNSTHSLLASNNWPNPFRGQMS